MKKTDPWHITSSQNTFKAINKIIRSAELFLYQRKVTNRPHPLCKSNESLITIIMPLVDKVVLKLHADE